MRITADLHTHTIASNHAYSTISEMAAGAAKAGLEAIGITDHAPMLGDAPHLFYFQNLISLPRRIADVLVFRGAEVNILNQEGDVDLPEREMSRLDYTIASLHNPVYYPTTEQEHTSALCNVMENKDVMILGHIGRCNCAMDHEKVLKKAKEKRILIEINDHSFVISPYSMDNCKKIALLCKELEVPIVVNSDAHFSSHIGNWETALKILSDIDFPEDLVMNTSTDKFINYLKSKKELSL